MPFFARPNLDDVQFKQLTGTTLTLSGQTRIATTSGLTLSDGAGGNVIITADGAGAGYTDYYVMSFDPADSKIKLMPSAASGTSMYTGASPASVTVGGVTGGTTLSGKTVSQILEEILVPAVEPSIVSSPFSQFCISPSTCSILEVGTQVTLTGCIYCFNRGCVNPVYYPANQDGFRVGSGTCYTFTYWGNTCNCLPTSPSISFGTQIIQPANNVISGSVCYAQGCCVYKSNCTPSACAQCPAGSTSSCSPPTIRCINITGIYPYYYGKVVDTGSRPAVTNALVTGGTKVVASSTGTVTVTFSSAANEYTWLAIPSTSCSRVCWYVNALDNGKINTSVTDKYPDVCNISICSPIWCCAGFSPQTYKVYMSKTFGAITCPMEFRCS